jgi:hypothetical protein
MRTALRASAATIAAAVAFGIAGGPLAGAGSATGTLSLRVVVVNPTCGTGPGCTNPSAGILAPRTAQAAASAPVAVSEQRQGDQIVRTVIY